MTDAEDDWGPRLAAVAERAAPGVAPGPHVVENDLARIRLGAEEPALDSSYLHLAGCASCRARLVEAPEVAMAAVTRVAKPRRDVLIRSVAWAAAALVVIGLGYGVTRGTRAPERLTVLQRPYAGVMGSHASERPSENTNLELSFTTDGAFSAFVVPCDEAGKVLSSPQWFVRESTGRAVVVLTPRTFLPHSSGTRGLLVWGTDREVRPVADALSGLALTPSPSSSEAALAKLVKEHGARMQWLPLTPL